MSLLNLCHGEKTKDEIQRFRLAIWAEMGLLNLCHGEKTKDEIQRFVYCPALENRLRMNSGLIRK